jgi:hypothetical protein
MLWNKLPLEVKQQDNIFKFKNAVKKYFNVLNNIVLPSKFNCPPGKTLATVLLHIRMGLSPLNGHRFQYNLTENPFCPSCLAMVETSRHYFLECSAYTFPRVTLLANVHDLVVKITDLPSNNLTSWEELSSAQILHMLTHGLTECIVLSLDSRMRDLIVDIDNDLYSHVMTYMFATKRFVVST